MKIRIVIIDEGEREHVILLSRTQNGDKTFHGRIGNLEASNKGERSPKRVL